MALGDCGVFGPELVKSIVSFREKTRENEDATKRVTRLKRLSKEEGMGMDTATITIDQLLPQLPEFSGTSSLTVLDAFRHMEKQAEKRKVKQDFMGRSNLKKIKKSCS